MTTAGPPVGTDTALASPEYGFPAILLRFQRLVAEEWLWQSTYDQLGILPLHIDYEDYVEDRPGHLRRIADFLDEPVVLQPLHDHLTVMADDWTAVVVERSTTDLHRPEERDPADRRSVRPVRRRRFRTSDGPPRTPWPRHVKTCVGGQEMRGRPVNGGRSVPNRR
jgi:hypothetical protein